MKVFLGGTCNGSNWREKLKPMLRIDFFDPVVPNWTEEDYVEELKQREECDFCLYVITPKMKGVYSIAEAVDDSNKRPEKAIFCVLTDAEDGKLFDQDQITSLTKVGLMIRANGGEYCATLEEVASYLNKEVDAMTDYFWDQITGVTETNS